MIFPRKTKSKLHTVGYLGSLSSPSLLSPAAAAVPSYRNSLIVILERNSEDQVTEVTYSSGQPQTAGVAATGGD